MSGHCLFCSIIEKKIPANIALETEKVLAFHDINPQAPTHILIIPKTHVANVSELTSEHDEYLVEMIKASKKLSTSLKDFRLVTNNGERAGQSVFHLHFHLLGGRDFSWPPG